MDYTNVFCVSYFKELRCPIGSKSALVQPMTWRSTVEQNRDSKQLLVIHISDLILIIK